MFALSESMNFYLYRHPVDMRKGFDRLSGMVTNNTALEPLSGDAFVFINKRRNTMKVLRWETGGFVLYHKRLEKGVFERTENHADGNVYDIPYVDLVMLVAGIKTKNAVRKKRYKIA